jgi:hypothetical protein
MKRIANLIFILFVVAACKEVFEAPPQSLLQASFLNSVTKATISPKITAWGAGHENLWVEDTVLQDILLPLSENDTTSYLISFDKTIDTVTFIHETTPKYASMESGFFYEYKLNSIDFTHNRIDSIQIIDSLVTQKWHENIKLYIRPLPAGSN